MLEVNIVRFRHEKERSRMHVRNTAKAIMQSGEPAFGWGLGLGSPLVAERMAQTGVDFLLVDAQHGSFSADSVLPLVFMAINAGGSVPMARVARNDYTLIGRLLDEGALGIVVPMVHTAADAKAAADACRFPTNGTRSWGWARAAAYGDDYPTAVDNEIFLAVQIESAEAVENAEAILGTEGVDGCWIGPSDLTLSLGYRPGSEDGKKALRAATDKVLEACAKTGKVPGYAGSSPTEGRELAERGFRYITAGSDAGFMISGARAGIKILRGEG
jgi:4-hydroxy-2-oxoheptanedioate aldolase